MATDESTFAAPWHNTLCDDLIERILKSLPLQTLGLTSCVCKRWRTLSTSAHFVAFYNRKHNERSWLYINGFKYSVTDAHAQFSPSALDQYTTPSPLSTFSPNVPPASWGPGGLCYVLSGTEPLQQKILYKTGPLDKKWLETPELKHPRTMPIAGVVIDTKPGTHKLVCVGGLPCEETKETSLKVEIFSSESKAWEECEDFPSDFKGLATARTVTAAVNNQKLYVLHIHSGMIASFDVRTKSWSKVKILRLPAAQYCYLTVQNRSLLLIGASYENDKFVFRGWGLDEVTMECCTTGIPPQLVTCQFTNNVASKNSTTITTPIQITSHNSPSKPSQERDFPVHSQYNPHNKSWTILATRIINLFAFYPRTLTRVNSECKDIAGSVILRVTDILSIAHKLYTKYATRD